MSLILKSGLFIGHKFLRSILIELAVELFCELNMTFYLLINFFKINLKKLSLNVNTDSVSKFVK